MPRRYARFLGALLARDSATAAALAGRFGDGDWERIVFLAGEDLLTPELAEPLRALAPVAHVPPEVVDHAVGLRALNAERNRRVAAQLVEMLPAFAAAGTRPLLLKGARAFADAASDRRDRVLRDLDLLFPADQLGGAASVLEELGYLRRDTDPGDHAVGYYVRAGEPAAVDLHREALMLPHLLPASEVLRRARPAAVSGHAALVAEPADEVLHGVLHEAVHHLGHRDAVVSLRALFDVASGLPVLAPAAWAALRERAARGRCSALLAAALRLCGSVFGPGTPPAGAATPAGGVPARLATARVWAKAEARLPGGVDAAWGATAYWLASYRHRPGLDGPFVLWKAGRCVSGSFRALARLRRLGSAPIRR